MSIIKFGGDERIGMSAGFLRSSSKVRARVMVVGDIHGRIEARDAVKEYEYVEKRTAGFMQYHNKWYWISVLRGINRILRFNLNWDFKNKKWRLK